jgi:hypothetical protein
MEFETPKEAGIDHCGIRQISAFAQLLGSLLVGINCLLQNCVTGGSYGSIQFK